MEKKIFFSVYFVCHVRISIEKKYVYKNTQTSANIKISLGLNIYESKGRKKKMVHFQEIVSLTRIKNRTQNTNLRM